MIDKIFKQDAKSIVDVLFDTKIFTDKISRDDMATVEEMIESMLQSRFDSYKKAQKLYESIKQK